MVIYGRFDVLASTLMRNARTVCTMLIRNGFRLLFSIQRKHEGDMKRKSKRNHQLGVCVCVCVCARAFAQFYFLPQHIWLRFFLNIYYI